MHEDDLLWQGLTTGNMDRLLALYKKYYHTLLFIGIKEVKDAQLVKDAIQQHFMYLWEKRGSLGVAKNVKAYLITSFLRQLSADWKKTQRATKLHVAWTNFAQEIPASPEESLIAKDHDRQLSKRLLHYINRLPARQKELIIYRFYEGLSYDEIAQKTGLTHRTVYNKIYEALKALRLELEDTDLSHTAMLSLLLPALLASSSVVKTMLN